MAVQEQPKISRTVVCERTLFNPSCPVSLTSLFMLLFYVFSYENSLNTILRLEALRYNNLLGRISTSLNQLRRALKGEIIMSFAIENTFECVANRQVPERWKEVRTCSRCNVVRLGMYATDSVICSYLTTASSRWTATSRIWQRGCPSSKIGPAMGRSFQTNFGSVDSSSPNHFSPLFLWTSQGKKRIYIILLLSSLDEVILLLISSKLIQLVIPQEQICFCQRSGLPI